MIKKTLLTIGIILFSYVSYAQIANDAAQYLKYRKLFDQLLLKYKVSL